MLVGGFSGRLPLQPVPIESDYVLHLHVFGPKLFESLAFGAQLGPELIYLLFSAVPHVFEVVLHVQRVDRMYLVPHLVG